MLATNFSKVPANIPDAFEIDATDQKSIMMSLRRFDRKGAKDYEIQMDKAVTLTAATHKWIMYRSATKHGPAEEEFTFQLEEDTTVNHSTAWFIKANASMTFTSEKHNNRLIAKSSTFVFLPDKSKMTIDVPRKWFDSFSLVESEKVEPITVIVKLTVVSSSGFRNFQQVQTTPEACMFCLKMVPKFRDIVFRHDRLGLMFEVENEDFENIYDEELAVHGYSAMIVNLRIQVVHSIGLRSFRTVSYDFCKPSDDSDCMLIFKDDKKIYVNLGYLCQLSDYFSYLRRRKSELPIDTYSNLPFETISDVDYDEFSTLLHVVYPSKYAFNDLNVHFLLTLADRFLFEGLLSDLEKYLVDPKSNRIDILLKLQWSFQYQMASLQGFVLSQLNTHESLRELRHHPNYSNLSSEVVKCLLDRIMDLPPPARVVHPPYIVGYNEIVQLCRD